MIGRRYHRRQRADVLNHLVERCDNNRDGGQVICVTPICTDLVVGSYNRPNRESVSRPLTLSEGFAELFGKFKYTAAHLGIGDLVI